MFFFISLTLTVSSSYAQIFDENLVQFSGVIVNESLKPVPYCGIIERLTRRGTISDANGFFSFVARKNDVIEFTAIGYKNVRFRIPDTLTTHRYSLIQVMTRDTILLKTTVIYPWPTYQQFKEAFVKAKIPDDDLEKARKNLALQEYKESMYSLPMDGKQNYTNFIQNYVSQNYWKGQYAPNNLLNPLAWAKFVKAWKNGDLKRTTSPPPKDPE
jgi:hypothetical protein